MKTNFLRAQIAFYKSFLSARLIANRSFFSKKKFSCRTVCPLIETSTHRLIASDAKILHEMAIRYRAKLYKRVGQRFEDEDSPMPTQST